MSKASYYKWEQLPQTDMSPKIKRRLVTGEKVMMVEFTMKKGAIIKKHSHPHEQITHIISGSIELEIQGEKQVIHGGNLVHIPSNLPHTSIVLEDTVTFDIFSPPREDFLSNETEIYTK